MRPITTAGDLIAADSSARPGPITLSRTSPRSGSSAGLSSAASSTSTSEPLRSPGQDQWPSSGIPQVIELHLQGLSYAQISAILNAEGIPTPMGRPRWLKSYVDRLLHTRYTREMSEELSMPQRG